MTVSTQFKILEVLEPALGREKAAEFTELIEDIVDAKFQDETKTLATKEDLHKTLLALKEDLHKTSIALKEGISKVSERLEGRIWTAFITLAVMILGLYATIIFRH